MKARHLLTIKACRDTKGEHSGCLQPTVTASETAFLGSTVQIFLKGKTEGSDVGEVTSGLSKQ